MVSGSDSGICALSRFEVEMTPEEKENSGILREISNQVKKTHEQVIRVEERLVNLNDRVSNLDKNVEVIRSSQQRIGTEVALIQAENIQRKEQVSGLYSRVDLLENNVGEVEHTGRLFIQKTTHTWKVVVIVGSIFVTVAGLALAVAKYIW